MPEETTVAEQATETDIFQQQKQTIELLYDVLRSQQSESPAPTYVSPISTQTKPVPNYLLWAGIGIGLYMLLKG